MDGDQTICDECAGIQKQAAAPAEPVTEPTPEPKPEPVPETLPETLPETKTEPVVEAAETQPTEDSTQESTETFELNTDGAEEVKPIKEKKKKDPKKKKKIALISTISAAAVVAVGVLLVVLNFNAVKGLFLKNFGEPSDYMSHVEEQNLDGFASALSEAYGSLLGASTKDASGASRFEVELEVGDDLMALLEAALVQEGAETDLSWLNKMMLSLESNVQDEKAQASVGFGLADKQLLTLDMIYDIKEQVIWLGVPELNDQFISFDMTEMLEEARISVDPEQFKVYEDMQKALPSEETVAKLLDKYIEIALDCVDDVEKETETVEIDGVRQKLTVLTIKIKEETLYEMAIAILEEAKDDKEIKKILTDFEKFYNDYNADMMAEYSDEEYEPIDLYEAFTEGVEDALDTLPDLVEDADSDNYFKIVDYVGKSDEVVGRELSIHSKDADKIELFNYLTVRSGSKFAFEAEIPSAEIKMTGSGTEKSNKINGSYVIRYQKTKLIEIEVIDFDSKKLDDGYLNGTVRISPTSELLDLFIGTASKAPTPSDDYESYEPYASYEAYESEESSAAVPSALMSLIEEIAIELKFESSEKLTKVGINLVSDNDLLIGLALSAIQKNAETIKTPDNAVDITEMDENAQSALTEWVKNIKVDEFIQSLKDAGVPAEYADLLSGLGDMIASGGFGGTEEAPMYPNDDWGDDWDDEEYWEDDTDIDTEWNEDNYWGIDADF